MNTPSTTFQIVFYSKNRKLYCKHTSSYVTLSDVYEMYRNGFCVNIVEHGSNKEMSKEIIIKSIMHFGPNYETKIKLLSKVMGQTV